MTGYTDTFSADVHRSDADASAVVALAGELDLASAPELQRCLEELFEGGAQRVVVDLGDLAFIDSTGISALVRGKNRALDAGRSLALRRPRPGVRRVLEITGVTAVLAIED